MATNRQFRTYANVKSLKSGRPISQEDWDAITNASLEKDYANAINSSNIELAERIRKDAVDMQASNFEEDKRRFGLTFADEQAKGKRSQMAFESNLFENKRKFDIETENINKDKIDRLNAELMNRKASAIGAGTKGAGTAFTAYQADRLAVAKGFPTTFGPSTTVVPTVGVGPITPTPTMTVGNFVGATGVGGIGGNLGEGLVLMNNRNASQKTRREAGAIGGAVSGAAYGSIVPGVGTVVGGIIGGISGAISGNSEASVICTELHRQGLISYDIYFHDNLYRLQFVPQDVYFGYLDLCEPVAKKMALSKRVTRLVSVLAIPTAKEMAHRICPHIEGSWLGKIVLRVGFPLCRLAYMLKKKEEVYE